MERISDTITNEQQVRSCLEALKQQKNEWDTLTAESSIHKFTHLVTQEKLDELLPRLRFLEEHLASIPLNTQNEAQSETIRTVHEIKCKLGSFYEIIIDKAVQEARQWTQFIEETSSQKDLKDLLADFSRSALPRFDQQVMLALCYRENGSGLEPEPIHGQTPASRHSQVAQELFRAHQQLEAKLINHN